MSSTAKITKRKPVDPDAASTTTGDLDASSCASDTTCTSLDELGYTSDDPVLFSAESSAMVPATTALNDYECLQPDNKRAHERKSDPPGEHLLANKFGSEEQHAVVAGVDLPKPLLDLNGTYSNEMTAGISVVTAVPDSFRSSNVAAIKQRSVQFDLVEVREHFDTSDEFDDGNYVEDDNRNNVNDQDVIDATRSIGKVSICKVDEYEASRGLLRSVSLGALPSPKDKPLSRMKRVEVGEFSRIRLYADDSEEASMVESSFVEEDADDGNNNSSGNGNRTRKGRGRKVMPSWLGRLVGQPKSTNSMNHM